MVVILTEEPSMKVFLETLISRMYPNLKVKIISHQGKQDLDKNIPKILRSWLIPDTKFIVIHDQDSWDCVQLKSALKAKCNAVRPDVVVRIACQELEAWYWGDLSAVEEAFEKNNLQHLKRQRKYRVPDSIVNAKDELQKHLPRYEQRIGARKIAEKMIVSRNTSRSFNVFWSSLQAIAEQACSNLE